MDVKRIREHFETAKRNYEAAKITFQDKFDTNPAYALEWSGADIFIAQARYELALQFDPAEDDDEKLAEGLAEWQRRTFRRLDLLVRTNSRSTSQLANLRDDAQNQATLELVGLISGESY